MAKRNDASHSAAQKAQTEANLVQAATKDRPSGGIHTTKRSLGQQVQDEALANQQRKKAQMGDNTDNSMRALFSPS